MGRVSYSRPQSPMLALQMQKADGESQFGASRRAEGQVRQEASADLTVSPPVRGCHGRCSDRQEGH